MKINIIADIHNMDRLGLILSKFEDLICLGDIGAGIKIKDFLGNVERYKKTYRAYAKNNFSETKLEDKEWFARLNIHAWITQLETIKKAGKKFTLSAGNADTYFVKTFPECKTALEETLAKSSMSYIEQPSLKSIGNMLLLFLPYTDSAFELDSLLNKINPDKLLLVLGHCPPFFQSKKTYYRNYFEALKKIRAAYGKDFLYIHGHMHPDNSYSYTRQGLWGINILALKSDEDKTGISVRHDFLELDCETGKYQLFNFETGEKVQAKPLPEKYLANEDHWNETDPSK